MKKDRNTFFQESQYMNNTTFPNQNMIPQQQPFTMGSFANQGFYAGGLGAIPQNYNTGMNTNQTNYSIDYNDIEARLSKIERQINRLDLRLNKLENNSFYTTDDLDNTTNVYMV